MPRCATPSSSSPSSQTPVVVCPQPWPTILEGDAVLASQVAPQDPARAIVDAARSGELTVYKRDTLVNEAALAQMRATYAGDLRRRIEPLMVAAFHRALDDGAADEILDSLRPSFDQAAEAIAKAKSLGINAESSTEHIISRGARAGHELAAARRTSGHRQRHRCHRVPVRLSHGQVPVDQRVRQQRRLQAR